MQRHSMSSKARPALRRQHAGVAFTLTELALVLLIVFVLAAILFPVFARPRHHDSRHSCAPNEKLLALAFLSYAQDYDGRLPPVFGTPLLVDKAPRPTWARAASVNLRSAPALLEGYAVRGDRSLFRCPQEESKQGQAEVISVTYRYNDLAATVRLTDEVSAPHSTVLLMDGENDWINAGHGAPTDPTGRDCRPDKATGTCYPGTGSNISTTAVIRHNGGANYAFLDGHVKWLVPDAVYFPPAASGSRVHREKNGALLGPALDNMAYGGKKYGATFFIR